MSPVPVSVVIVSRNRPRWLRRCVLALGQLDYPLFDVVVVACAEGVTAASHVDVPVEVTVRQFDDANIARARNLGISLTRGDVIAFIDDDAVPEPTWLSHLVTPFTDTEVAQAGGTTLGRNGISVQHAASLVTRAGVSVPVVVEGDDPFEMIEKDGLFPRLHGTNMAIRRSVLVERNGFDPRFAFYLDETDLTLRISQDGGRTVCVPKAVVHHASGPSDYRRADRAPLSVFEIGASAGVFHRKHTPENERDAARHDFVNERRRWLLRYMQSGALAPDDVMRLQRELVDGYATGLQREPEDQPELEAHVSPAIAERDLRQFEDVFLIAKPGTRPSVTAHARDMVRQGKRVTVFDYRNNARYHRVAFTEDGYWLHTGGIFGRELRTDPLLTRSTRNRRVIRSLDRLKGIRSELEIIRSN